MSRPRKFFTVPVSASCRRLVRAFCAQEIERVHGNMVELADLIDGFFPIEGRVAYHIMEDIAHGDGYDHSTVAMVMDRKAYYLRKRHLYYCLVCKMPQLLAEIEARHA